MLGFFGMMVVFLAVICLLSYWVSWDLQHKAARPGFGTQIRNDIAVSLRSLTAKYRRAVMKKSVAPGVQRAALENPSIEGYNGANLYRNSVSRYSLVGRNVMSRNGLGSLD